MANPQPPQHEKRIAVVAIHGVGDHLPFESARAIGDLLEDLETANHVPQYAPFQERILRLNVRPTKIGAKRITPNQGASGPMHAIGKAVRAGDLDVGGADRTNGLDHIFMETQLSEYKGDKPEDTYQLLRLEGERVTGAKRIVDIYDMYWSDLSSLGTAFTRILSELYQLLFHLASIGAHNIEAAAITLKMKERESEKIDPDSVETTGLRSAAKWWNVFSESYLLASDLLNWPIALYNLFLLAFVPAILGISLLRNHATPLVSFLVADGLATVAAAGLFGAVLLKAGRFGFALFVGVLVAAAGIGTGIFADFYKRLNPEWIDAAIGFFLVIAGAAVVWAIVNAFENRRPGSRRSAVVLLAVFAVVVFFLRHRLAFSETRYVAIKLAANAIEILFGLLAIVWILFAVLYGVTLILGWLALKFTPKTLPVERDRAKRTLWTAVLTLTLPPILFLMLTLLGWTGILQVTKPLLPAQILAADLIPGACPGVCYTPIFPVFGSSTTLAKWADQMMDASGMNLFPVLLGALLLSLAVALWCFAPSVWNEISPPPFKPGERFAHDSLALGTWLTDGFRFLRFAGWVLLIGTLLFFVPFYFPQSGQTADRVRAFTEAMGTLVVGASAGLIGFGGRLQKLALGFRPVVRVMLDVDNWLREHPRDANPTARICARYTSLLRHIAGHTIKGEHYDALVIVAHSQGTVITADLLRYLSAEYARNHNYDPDLLPLLSREMPIYLFTMGSPLRQLYGLRFPFLYEYARHQRPKGGGGIAIPPHTNPDPETLGVRKWVNAYRSGDYVGRYLWRPDDSDANWEPAAESDDANAHRVEFCVGPGAHTHYWDSTATPISSKLDEIIRHI